jgi:hypothetical protein
MTNINRSMYKPVSSVEKDSIGKLTVTHKVKKNHPAFMKTEDSSPCSEEPATVPILGQMNPMHTLLPPLFP